MQARGDDSTMGGDESRRRRRERAELEGVAWLLGRLLLRVLLLCEWCGASVIGCGGGEAPSLLLHSSTPLLVCSASPCLAAANVSCVLSTSACAGRQEWMRSVEVRGGGLPLFTCCESPDVRRSALVRTVSVLSGHSAFMRGFQLQVSSPTPAFFQFGEILTSFVIHHGYPAFTPSLLILLLLYPRLAELR